MTDKEIMKILPPDLREAYSQLDDNVVAEQINAYIAKEKAKNNFEESRVEEFTKAMRIKEDTNHESDILEKNNEIKRELDKIFGPREQEMADLEKNINDYYFNTCLDIFAANAMKDMLVVEFNTFVDVLSKIEHDYKARLEIVDELIKLAYQIKKAGRASKEDTDKILCFYGFLHTLYSHQLYPHRISYERVERKAMEVGKRNYQDNPFVSPCSYPFKSVDDIKKQYTETMVELKRIFNK